MQEFLQSTSRFLSLRSLIGRGIAARLAFVTLRLMNKAVRNVWVGCLAVFLAGCMMHTVVGNGCGVASPDGNFSLAVRVDGASGKAYVDRTKKTVFLWMLPSGTNDAPEVSLGKYIFVAAGLSWDVRWLSASEVTVHLFDHADGESQYSPQRTITNRIADLTFTQVAGVFVEKK